MAGLHNTTQRQTASGLAASVTFLTNRAYAAFQTWRLRVRGRRHLALLDEHQLRDIGLDPLERDREVVKPFWRP